MDAAIWEIELAYDGRLECLQAIYGGGDQTPAANTVPATAENVKKMFAFFKKGKPRG